jgi:hypothetical protein
MRVTSANPTQMLRAPAARGARNKGCYFLDTSVCLKMIVFGTFLVAIWGAGYFSSNIDEEPVNPRFFWVDNHISSKLLQHSR